MEYLIFRELLKYNGVIEAEDRFILQRQLDNHIKVKSKKLVETFTDIYEEFQSVINPAIKICKKTTQKISVKEAKERWNKTLGKLI
jgi:hypothetical protein